MNLASLVAAQICPQTNGRYCSHTRLLEAHLNVASGQLIEMQIVVLFGNWDCTTKGNVLKSAFVP